LREMIFPRRVKHARPVLPCLLFKDNAHRSSVPLNPPSRRLSPLHGVHPTLRPTSVATLSTSQPQIGSSPRALFLTMTLRRTIRQPGSTGSGWRTSGSSGLGHPDPVALRRRVRGGVQGLRSVRLRTSASVSARGGRKSPKPLERKRNSRCSDKGWRLDLIQYSDNYMHIKNFPRGLEARQIPVIL